MDYIEKDLIYDLKELIFIDKIIYIFVLILKFIIKNFFNILTIGSCIGSIYNFIKLKIYKKEILEKIGLQKDFEDFNKNKFKIITELNKDLLDLEEDSYEFRQEYVRSLFTCMTGLEASYSKIFNSELNSEIIKLKTALKENFHNNNIAQETITECVESLTKITSLIKKVENNEWLK